MEFSIINYYGKQTSKCGYCKGQACSVAHGMHAHRMSPRDYQDLIDRGWRRSGHYCYKPHNQNTCCPCYTIKCDAQEFKLSKSHKKILKRMNRFLRDGKKDPSEMRPSLSAAANKEASNSDTINIDTDDGGGGCIRDEPQAPNVPLRDIDLDAVAAANPERFAAGAQEPAAGNFITIKSAAMQIDENASASLASSGSLVGSKQSYDSTKPPCKKAKQMRLERRQAKLAAKGIDASTATKQQPKNSNEKTLSDYINDVSPNDKHKLKLKLVHVESKQFSSSLKSTYALYKKYQTRVHNDPPENVQEYLDFLQRSPLKYTKPHDGPTTGFGSFHQQYWLDDKLIAVAVIDILPHCVSSVYFFYDPDYSFLSLGTYGSLRELLFVQELAAKVPTLKYYYMGFYIHSCPKMRYKGKLLPSYLLCPETYIWILLDDEMRVKLDENKYQRLNADTTAKDLEDFLENHLESVLLLVENNTCISYREYIQSFNIETLDNMLDMIRSRIYKEITGDDDDRELILEYGRLVGKTCAHRMLYLKM